MFLLDWLRVTAGLARTIDPLGAFNFFADGLLFRMVGDAPLESELLTGLSIAGFVVVAVVCLDMLRRTAPRRG